MSQEETKKHCTVKCKSEI